MEKLDKTQKLENIANAVAMFYSNKGLINFLPALNKGGRRGGKNNVSGSAKQKQVAQKILSTNLPYELTEIPGHPALDGYLKKATSYYFPPKKSKSTSDISELKQAIDIIKMQITVAVRKNLESGEHTDSSIDEKRKSLEILEQQFILLNSEDVTEAAVNYNELAATALKILQKNDGMSKKLYTMIREKVVPSHDNSRSTTSSTSRLEEVPAEEAATLASWRTAPDEEKSEPVEEPRRQLNTDTSDGFKYSKQNSRYDDREDRGPVGRSSRGIGGRGGGRSGFEPHSKDIGSDKNDRYNRNDKFGNNRQSFSNNKSSFSKNSSGSYVPPHLRSVAMPRVEEDSRQNFGRFSKLKNMDDADFPEIGQSEDSRIVIISNKITQKKLIGAWGKPLSEEVLAPPKEVEVDKSIETQYDYDEFGFRVKNSERIIRTKIKTNWDDECSDEDEYDSECMYEETAEWTVIDKVIGGVSSADPLVAIIPNINSGTFGWGEATDDGW